jgi:hypothetical protein
MPGRDCQRGRVYAWENRMIAPCDRSLVPCASAQGMVDAIWADLGLRFPPKVERLPRQARTTLADASRLRIRLPEPVPSWCILHELAHAMTSTHDGASDGHGPLFMGVYVRMLERYMRIERTVLIRSLAEARIALDPDAMPVFLDGSDRVARIGRRTR